jgi:nitroimidazol reductase NimA-like FMN-containing flavoprotein (pyridoxamine 5'-phosphate oxidase superfamily)
MKSEDREVLRHLLTEVRVLSLGVLVEGEPYVGLLPFVVGHDFQSVLVHASDLAKHSRGLQEGSPFSFLIHGTDEPDGDPLQVARVTISGTVHQVARTEEEYPRLRDAYIDRFPTSERTFMLGDFYLYKLQFERGRLVAGFARAVNLRPESFVDLNLP